MRSHRTTVLFAVLIAAVLAAPATAAPTAAIPEGAIPFEGGYAKELKAETPDWYTPELHQRVLDAGAPGRILRHGEAVERIPREGRGRAAPPRLPARLPALRRLPTPGPPCPAAAWAACPSPSSPAAS